MAQSDCLLLIRRLLLLRQEPSALFIFLVRILLRMIIKLAVIIYWKGKTAARISGCEAALRVVENRITDVMQENFNPESTNSEVDQPAPSTCA
jgi:hypothetical protein